MEVRSKMEVLRLLDELEDILENASTLPFSSKVMVDAEELFEIIREIRIKLPDELKQASWIKEERQRILAEAQKDADTILSEAELRLEELIEEDEITKKAKERAEEIITKAQNNAKSIRLGALEYADNILLETQENLKEIIELLNNNRQELRGDR
ncbi:MAG: ATPase [Tissierellia bacterium]|nr:ATPase [Tissierellia bacterium]